MPNVYLIEYIEGGMLVTVFLHHSDVAWSFVQGLMSDSRVSAVMYPACIDPTPVPDSVLALFV